ncbi:MAG: (2Fe-2S)-binding protein [Marinobacter sp.]|uniref:(2Fe-2S)-binding protein n=1 Tax=Marinobacter sp. TaxID=50741 RepID=UPI00299D7FCE|nr:(2Fe-2S)-binding protein [Marinobacter sp.]MDX1636143.1 (2Fe-2S)-binding protein [Marinobacter sp.]
MAGANDWLATYQGLLADAGVSPSDLAPQASLPVSESDGPSLAQCLARPDRVRSDFGAGLSEQGLRVRASVMQQSLALSVLTPVVLRFLLTGASHLPGDDALRLVANPDDSLDLWACDQPRPSASLHTLDQLFDTLAGRARAWYPVFRKGLGVSPGAYWSSIGLGFCAPFSMLYDRSEPDRLCQQASLWLDSFDCDARRYIEWIPAMREQGLCAIPQRRGCCLKFKLPERGYCGTCSIHRRERMSALALGLTPEL